VQPGEQDEFVSGLDAVESVGEGGVDLEQRVRCAFERLIGSVAGQTERRVDDADRMHHVRLGFGHGVRVSHHTLLRSAGLLILLAV
jgi:hypothetical protein